MKYALRAGFTALWQPTLQILTEDRRRRACTELVEVTEFLSAYRPIAFSGHRFSWPSLFLAIAFPGHWSFVLRPRSVYCQADLNHTCLLYFRAGGLVDFDDLAVNVNDDTQAKHAQHIAGLKGNALGNYLVHVDVT